MFVHHVRNQILTLTMARRITRCITHITKRTMILLQHRGIIALITRKGIPRKVRKPRKGQKTKTIIIMTILGAQKGVIITTTIRMARVLTTTAHPTLGRTRMGGTIIILHERITGATMIIFGAEVVETLHDIRRIGWFVGQ